MQEMFGGLRPRSCVQRNRQAMARVSSGSAQPNIVDIPRSIRVAVLDTGFNIFLPQITGYGPHIGGLRSFVDEGLDENNNPPPVSTHGLHCACLLLEVAPERDLFFGRTLDNRDYLRITRNLAEATFYAVNTWRVDIISISGETTYTDLGLAEALKHAYVKGASVFVATHNDGKNSSASYPARARTVLGISSTDNLGDSYRNRRR